MQQSAQSIASDTDVALTFGAASEEIDTHAFHDVTVNNSRIIPTVAGYYRLSGTVFWAADTDVISTYSSIGKNGSIIAPRVRAVWPSTATASATRSSPVTAIQSANGTTDYFELFGRQLQAAAAALSTGVSGSFSSVFECEFLRGL
ncbi:hypothetical protein ACWKSP_26585 [Micromonosporaceae bacterium Da 78-11]